MSLDFKSLIGAGSGDSGGGLASGLAGSAASSAMGVDTTCLPSLTLQQRFIAFGSCFCAGMVLSLLSTLSLGNPVQVRPPPPAARTAGGVCARAESGAALAAPPPPMRGACCCRAPTLAHLPPPLCPPPTRAPCAAAQFGVLYTLGNIVALFSTAFLFGPVRQLKNMFHSKRAIATIIYLATLIGTLVVAIMTGSIIAVLCMIIVQFLALVWYTLSYIPYARDLVWGCLSKCGQ